MLWRDGLLSSSFGEPIQRWLCRDCGYRFSDPKDVKIAKKAFEAVETVDTKTLKTPVDIVISRQICVTETKNLDAEPIIVGVLRRKETGEFKQKLIDYALWLFENGRRETTITGRVKLLRRLVQRGANLYDPESVKKIISKQTWSDGQKTMQSTHTLHF